MIGGGHVTLALLTAVVWTIVAIVYAGTSVMRVSIPAWAWWVVVPVAVGVAGKVVVSLLGGA